MIEVFGTPMVQNNNKKDGCIADRGVYVINFWKANKKTFGIFQHIRLIVWEDLKMKLIRDNAMITEEK